MLKRLGLSIKGIVQGVGFRPFIFRLAVANDLTGFVLNNNSGVFIEIQGSKQNIDKFLSTLNTQSPPLCTIVSIKSQYITLVPQEKSFLIKKSNNKNTNTPDICPDISVCADCINEIVSPEDKRYQYPFNNCTNCGPRYSIIKEIPYDRHNTTMNEFIMCKQCRLEYNDPNDRRFHAQPVSCFNCGPSLYSMKRKNTHNVIEYAINELKNGKVLAIKGIGGFHLVCSAELDMPVLSLRRSKSRDSKPLALMVPDIEHACLIAKISDKEKELLSSCSSPIMLLEKRHGDLISKHIAPGLNIIGLMLPYTPLHYLLFYHNNNGDPNFSAIIMTSANIRSKPIIKDEQGFDPCFDDCVHDIISHNRRIEHSIDDSVLRAPQDGIIFLRRARGYSPFSKWLFKKNRPTLCLGAEKKNAIAITKEDICYMSPYIGDLKELDTFRQMKATVKKMAALYKIEPERVAYDTHPLYINTQWAVKLQLKQLPIQHHRAHIASVAGEKSLFKAIIGVAFDGSGYGDDGNIWGGEFFIGEINDLKRMAQLKYTKLQGGDSAVKEPYRSALGHLHDVYGKDIFTLDLDLFSSIEKPRLYLIIECLQKNINTFHTSSIGRLFDAVASLTGLRHVNTYEGQASMQLESSLPSYKDPHISYPFTIEKPGSVYLINPQAMIKNIVNDMIKRTDISIISLKFHNTIRNMIVNTCNILRDGHHIDTVALSGGVFQNKYLRDTVTEELVKNRYITCFNDIVSPGDEGIAFGQAVIANLTGP